MDASTNTEKRIRKQHHNIRRNTKKFAIQEFIKWWECRTRGPSIFRLCCKAFQYLPKYGLNRVMPLYLSYEEEIRWEREHKSWWDSRSRSAIKSTHIRSNNI